MFFGSKAKLSAGVFILAAMAVMTAQAQVAKPNFDGGPFGKTPANPPDQKVHNKVNPNDKDKPKALDCDEPYEVEVTLVQEAGCREGFDFSKLRKRAKEIADKEIAEVVCPKERCFVPSTWYGYWSWGCVDEDKARVSVTEFKSCAAPNTKVTNGIGDGGHVPQNKPETIGGPPPKEPADNGEYITIGGVTGKGNDGVVDCGVSFLAEYVCEFQKVPGPAALLEPLQKNGTKPPSSATIQNFQPFYDQAYDQAKVYHDSFQCADPAKCSLAPFAVVSGDLQAEAGAETVTITLYFWVQCKK